ncbi:MAG TPA: hypothetical protein VIP70_07610 [Nitrososphaeraceae archaeon]
MSSGFQCFVCGTRFSTNEERIQHLEKDDFVNIKDGHYANEPDILYRQTKKVSIKSKERDVTIIIDGERIGILPATFEVLKRSLTIRM